MARRFALPALALAALAEAAAPAAVQEQPPEARALWSISSPDCISVHADGEPWDECGFQASSMNPEGTRILTVSMLGAIQLWDQDGRELRRIEWRDDRSGASGFPSGRAVIAGGYGIAVVHQNQLAILDLTDGRVLSQAVHEDMMLFDEIALASPDGVIARGKTNDWKFAAKEISLPSGASRAVQWDEPAGIWIGGLRAPFRNLAARLAADAAKAAWACKPVDGRYCFRRDLPGREVHLFDLKTGESRSVDVGRSLGQFDNVWFAAAGEQSWAVICGRTRHTSPYLGACEVRDLVHNRRTYTFEASNLRADGGLDEDGRPELRLSVMRSIEGRDQRRIALDGTMRMVDPAGRAALMAPGGGMVLPEGDGRTSILVGVDGRPAARLPFAAQACGNGWPEWWGWCRVSADGRRLLMTSVRTDPDGEEKSGGLTLYALPLQAGAAAQSAR